MRRFAALLAAPEGSVNHPARIYREAGGQIEASHPAMLDWITKFTMRQTLDFYTLFAQLKHSAFAGEAEWRLIDTVSILKANSSVKFRIGDMGLTPYIEIPLTPRPNSLIPLKELIVSPGPHSELRVQSAGLYLKMLGYKNVDVYASRVPFRPA